MLSFLTCFRGEAICAHILSISQPRVFAIRVCSADDKVSPVDCMLTRLTH